MRRERHWIREKSSKMMRISQETRACIKTMSDSNCMLLDDSMGIKSIRVPDRRECIGFGNIDRIAEVGARYGNADKEALIWSR